VGVQKGQGSSVAEASGSVCNGVGVSVHIVVPCRSIAAITSFKGVNPNPNSNVHYSIATVQNAICLWCVTDAAAGGITRRCDTLGLAPTG